MILCLILICALAALFICWMLFLWGRVPGMIHIRAGVQQQLDLNVPVSGKLYRSDADTEDTIVEDVDGEDDITLDEAFIRNKSKDLHGAFSLNDMFRFRRELFGNNAAEMADAIELVSAMESYQEAEDYFYNDLGWDSDSEEVEEFMTIIRNHFR